MIPHILNLDSRLRRVMTRLVLGSVALLVLQACTTTSMPQPKYPIYMQDRPVEQATPVAEAPVEQTPATDDAQQLPPPVPMGNVQVTELAPPPPPPPPPAEMLAPAAPASTPRPSVSPQVNGAAYVYVLQAKDTLYGMSRRFTVPVKDLLALNGLTVDTPLRIGQKILLPASAVDKGAEEHANGAGMTKVAATVASAPVVKPAPPVVKPAAPAVAAVTKPVVAAPVVTPAPVKPVVAPTTTTTTTTTTVTTKPTVAAPAVAAAKPVVKPTAPPPVAGFPANAQLAQMGKGKFVWPVKGRILVPFGQLAPNVRNDGINIAAGSGTEIRAASDGVVVYEGDQVKELGNTIYIKHADGWYTGYSHLSAMKVKNNERVTKGQVIGTVGQTGTIDQPQLHFEIRYTPSTDIARPVDPTIVLP